MLELPESKFILGRLAKELAPNLHYHTVKHTLDVYNNAAYLAEKEAIDTEEKKTVLIAALYHDSGYLYQSEGHEAVSCKIAREVLPNYKYNDADIDKICRIIMATRLPQNPHSKPEEIICDADLDYLGRADFFEIGHGLYLEMLDAGKVTNEDEWNRLQINFMQQHHYFTRTSQQLRNAKKQENLNILLSQTTL